MSNYCYHYTNLDSLYHIVSNKCLHFGSLGMMNDLQETQLDEGLLHKMYQDEFVELDIPVDVLINREDVNDFHNNTFSFSTSKKEDDLTQWRAYTENRKGVCIEFDRSRLEKIVLLKLFNSFAPYPVSCDCVYDDEEKKRVLKEFIKKIRENGYYKTHDRYRAHFKNIEHLSRNDLSFVSDEYAYLRSFHDLCIRLKHNSFEAEKEVRFYFVKYPPIRSEVKIKPCSMGLTKYVEVPIDDKTIKSITLGPNVDERNKHMIESLFLQAFKTTIEVKKSSSPYV